MIISFIGDSLSRQLFAVLLEAVGTSSESCTYGKLGAIKFPYQCVHETDNITVRMHNENYGDNITKNQFFAQADIIVMNVGVWHLEQQVYGVRTNHTPTTYYSHMLLIMQEISRARRPHQLTVFRQSPEMRTSASAALQRVTQKLLPLFIKHEIPVIAHQSALPNQNLTTTSNWFHDNAHYCELALQLAWLTILMHIVRDWNNISDACRQ
mmetsp:Transcript_34757/g.74033  ORF Transcript_34757/g.74033 Transcript_34757/m.74033 type:complete len:210 (-) Transcript_34757:272-901(-)